MNSYQQRNYYTFVNGLEGAKSYPILPGQSLMLMDVDSPVCYMKTADTTGKPTLKCYKLVEVPEKELIKVVVDPNIEELKTGLTNVNKRIDEILEVIKGGKQDA